MTDLEREVAMQICKQKGVDPFDTCLCLTDDGAFDVPIWEIEGETAAKVILAVDCARAILSDNTEDYRATPKS